MTHSQKDVGPAFPCRMSLDSRENGMSLRDWFAGQALTGLCATETEEDRQRADDDPVTAYRIFAIQAYLLADAMIEQRKGKREK